MKKALSVALGGILMLSPVAYAVAADDIYEVTKQTTIDELNQAIKNPDFSTIRFGEDVTLEGQVNVTRAVQFKVDDAVTVAFDGAGRTHKMGLNITADLDFANNGNVIIRNYKNYGMHTAGKANVTLSGDGRNDSQFIIKGNQGFGIDSQGQEGAFTVKNTKLSVFTPQDGTEGTMIFNKKVSKVLFESATVKADKASGPNPWPASVYSEAPFEVTNSSFDSTTMSDYNLSVVNKAPVTFDNSNVNLATSQGAIPRCRKVLFFTFCKPYTALNTAGNTVRIVNSTVNADTTAGTNPDAKHEALQFQDATYEITDSDVTADSAGTDPKQEDSSTLKVNGDSNVAISAGRNPALDKAIKVVIDSGNVILPPATKGVVNSNGSPLREFVSDTTENTINVGDGDGSYTYQVSKTGTDGKKHVWAPAVKVTYCDSCDDTAGTVETPEESILISGTSVDNPFNNAKLHDGRWQIKNSDKSQEFYQKETDGQPATLVSEDIAVCPLVLPEPTAEPTMEPTAEPTMEPTAEPTMEPTKEPTMEPTKEPTKEPTAEPVVPGKGSSSGKPAKPSSGLASTGSSTVPLLGGGLALLVMGAGAVVARRRLRK